MRIIISNKFYYYRGGDCIYCINLEELLKSKGHDVAVFAMDFPENIDNEYAAYFPSKVSFSEGGIKGKINAFRRILSCPEVKSKFRKLIKDFKPDVVHLNNIHSYLSPVLAEIAKENNIRLIWTLHDYKLICPSYCCLRDDRPCELCFNDKFNVVKTKCMKGSMLASVIAYIESEFWNRERIQRNVDMFICPSRFLSEKMMQGGYHSSKLKVLPNFSNEKIIDGEISRKNDYYLYVGRLSYEKGMITLLETAKDLDYTLYIAGSGPLEYELKEKYRKNNNIKFLGHLNKENLNNYIKNSKFVVMPSEWYENNPLSGIESLLLGTPLLGAEIGGIPELINDDNGCLFESGNKDSLKSKINLMFSTEYNTGKIAENA